MPSGPQRYDPPGPPGKCAEILGKGDLAIGKASPR